MKSGGRVLIWVPLLLILSLSAVSFVSGQQPPKQPGAQPSYTAADMPKLMEITWGEDVIGAGTDPEAIRSLLQRGQLIIINDHAKKVKWLVTSGVLVNAKPETIFNCILDTPHYQDFMPMTSGVTATKLGPNIVDLAMTLEIRIMKGISLPIKYSIIHYHRPPYRSDWVKHTGNFEENSGFYQFVPVNGGTQTMLFYTIYSLPRIPIATNVFKKDPNLELVINISTATMVARALKKRAELVEKREPFIPGKGMGGNTVEVMSKDPKTINMLLKRGGLILLEDGPPMWATTAVAMDAPPADVFQLVSAFDKYPCYQSQVLKAEIREKTATSAKAFFQLNIDYALLSVPLKYTLNYALNPPNGMSWKWAEGDVPSQQGSWTFLPLEGGKKTLAFFRATEDLKSLPGFGGTGLRTAIGSTPTLEPAVLASQALLTARSTSEIMNKPAAARTQKLSACPKK